MKNLLKVMAVLALVARPVAAEEIVLKIASVAPDKTAWSEMLKKWQKGVEEKSGGRVKVRVFLGGILGSEADSVLKCKRGQIQAVASSLGSISSQVPEVNVLELPYLFKNAAEADSIIDGVLHKPMAEAFERAGYVVGFWNENGYRHFGTKDKFVKTPADLKGKKMRSQESTVHLDMWRAFGASPVAIPQTEVLPALQNGTVDGFDQALLYMVAANWHTSIKYLTLSGHMYQPAVIAFNKPWFDKLPADLQQILLDEGKAVQDFGRKKVRAMAPQVLQLIKDAGVQVAELTAAEKAAFDGAAKTVREKFRKSAKPTAVAMLAMVEAALKSGRK